MHKNMFRHDNNGNRLLFVALPNEKCIVRTVVVLGSKTKITGPSGRDYILLRINS